MDRLCKGSINLFISATGNVQKTLFKLILGFERWINPFQNLKQHIKDLKIHFVKREFHPQTQSFWNELQHGVSQFLKRTILLLFRNV